MIKFLNDIVYANFAQLSYFDWHKFDKSLVNFENNIFLAGPKVSDIFKDKESFKSILTPMYNKSRMTEVAGDFVSYQAKDHKTGKIVNIYDYNDYRLFLLYSEDRNNFLEKKVFAKCGLGDWEFVCAHDHFTVVAEMKKKNELRVSEYFNSGFQACAFKKGNDVMIAYRGSDDLWILQHTVSDWIYTNISLGLGGVPDSLTCAVWFYNEVVKLTTINSRGATQANIHITGHSMGGALAQYVAVYAGKKHPTVTWNALGIGYKDKKCNRIEEVFYYKQYLNNYDLFNDVKKDASYGNSIKNYYIHEDLTANLQKRIGRTICVDKKDMPSYDKDWDKARLENSRKFRADYNDIQVLVLGKLSISYEAGVDALRKAYQFTGKRRFADSHWVTNFIALMDDNGQINPMNFRESFKLNAIKSAMLETGFIPKVKGKDKNAKLEDLPIYYCLNLEELDPKKTSPIGVVKYNGEIKNIFKKSNSTWVKQFSNKWYNKTELELGSFCNADFMGDVRGGVSYSYIEAEIKKDVLQVDQRKSVLIKK